jgi:hypothetical protein
LRASDAARWQKQQEQQLQAALLADIWQLPDQVSTAAVHLLVETATADAGLAAAYGQYIQLDAHPNCLLQLFQWCVGSTAQLTDEQSKATLKRILLSVLGDLKAAWTDAAHCRKRCWRCPYLP